MTLARPIRWFFSLQSFFFFESRHVACGILGPRPGIEPTPPALEAWSLNHWTSREVPLPSVLSGKT